MNRIFSSKLGWLVLLVVLVAVNFLASAFHYRLDLTKEKRYTLNRTTTEIARSLDEEVLIDVFLKGDLNSGFRKLANSTEEFLQTLKQENASRISYRFISPEDEMEGTGKKYGDSLVAMGATPINLSVQIESGQQQNYIFPFALITYKGQQRLVRLYSGSSRVISQVEINGSEALLEYNFTKAFDELTAGAKPLIAYATGNGQPMDGSVYDLEQVLVQDYSVSLPDLNKIDLIPDTVKLLLIVKPTIKFSDDVKRKIDQYIMRGGSMLCFIDGLYAEEDSLRLKNEFVAFDRDLNLNDMFLQYGARINPDLIMDLQCDFLPFAVGGTPDQPQYEFLKWNYYPVFSVSNEHIITKNLGPVVGRFVNSVDTVGAPGIRKTILFASSPNSRKLNSPVIISTNENKNVAEDAAFREKNIPSVVLLEGRFVSHYRLRTSKERMDTLEALGTPFRESSENSKIIIAGDGDMVLNDVSPNQGPLPMGMNLFTVGSQYEYPFANRSFLMNCVEYLTGKPGIIEIRNKEIVLRLLDSQKVAEQKKNWQLINIGIPVLVVLLFGVMYQQIRKRKYSL